MRGIPALVAVAVACSFSACADEEGRESNGGVPTGEVTQEVIVGSIVARFDDTLRGGGVVAEGASLSGREDGVANASATVVIAGIPAGATVQRAWLYWAISAGSDTTATINASAVTGTAIGTAGSTCWGPANNFTFRADVASLVTGNGAYTIAGLPSSTSATGVDTDGVAIVVVYQNAASGTRRRVMLRDGGISTSGIGEVVTDTFTGVSSPLANPGTGRFHVVVGDGQAAADGTLSFNAIPVGVDQFPGSDGPLWDSRSYNVTVPAATANLAWSHDTTGDCLLFETAVLDFTVATCGDSQITGGEACDQGNTTNGDGCSATCDVEPGWSCTGTPSVCTAICGDGLITGGETCDDGDTSGGDGCSAVCAVEPGWTCMGSPSTCMTTCGDGVVAGPEACDDGDTSGGDGCSAVCAVEFAWTCTGSPSVCTTTCGDGLVASVEACDDGDVASGDGCSAVCTVENGWTCAGTMPSVCTTTCGDGVVAGGEACDDAGTTAGDGCDATCAIEPGWTCTGEPSACDEICGDGQIVGAEACDDAGTAPDDGCSATCEVEQGWSCTGAPSVCTEGCGDRIVVGSEECDDGNTADDDGCSATCEIEPGWDCTGEPSDCTEACGDGLVVGTEACDDGNTADTDGCSATCEIEPGWSCTGEPSTCTTGCGDSIIAGAEACDDGNATDGDGCSAACAVEPGWTCTTPGPSACTTTCGDTIIAGLEVCDDGNTAPEDGCSDACVLEPGWVCTTEPAQPTVCSELTLAGGGCDAGGATGGGMLILLAIGLAARRRRSVVTSLGLVAVAVFAAPRLASAQVVETGASTYSVERFRLAMDRGGFLDVESARVTGHLVVDVGVWFGYANDPLTVRVGGDHERVASLISDRFGGDLVASIGILSRFELGIAAPLIVSQDQDVGDLMGVGSISSFGLGDLRVMPKAALLADGPVELAVAANVTVPTSSSDDWFGDDGVTVAPELLLGHTAERFRAAVNLGYLIRKQQQSLGLAIDDELYLHAGAGFRVIPRAEVMASVGVATAASDPFGSFNSNHAEVRAGFGFDVLDTLRVFAAGGVGVGSGYGTADWRALAGVQLRAHREGAAHAGDEVTDNVIDRDNDKIADVDDKCPIDPETYNTFEDDDGCPDDDDADYDGVKSPADKCPDQPETNNGFEDDDGCPDTVPDRDGDNLSDPIDRCPDEPEDVDGFEDDDGCPELDNDNDGVVDASDRCPAEVGPIANSGCPDTDRDADSVIDRLDNCPDEPGPEKYFGCKGKQLVVMLGSQLKLLDVVYFKTAKATIQARSNRLLANVARVLVAHPELTRITVEGHTDDKGDDASNKDLSQRRADAVVQVLVKAGVPIDKLVSIGHGEEQPIADNKKAKGRAQNRRVEFKLEGIAAPAAPPTDAAAPATQPTTVPATQPSPSP